MTYFLPKTGRSNHGESQKPFNQKQSVRKNGSNPKSWLDVWVQRNTGSKGQGMARESAAAERNSVEASQPCRVKRCKQKHLGGSPIRGRTQGRLGDKSNVVCVLTGHLSRTIGIPSLNIMAVKESGMSLGGVNHVTCIGEAKPLPGGPPLWKCQGQPMSWTEHSDQHRTTAFSLAVCAST